MAVRDERRHGAHGVLGVLREAPGPSHHHASLRRNDPVFFGPRRNAVGAARQPHGRRELRGRAQTHGEEADRVFPHVLRRHGARRLCLGAALRAGFLRRRPRRVRERLPVRSGGRADVHPRRDTLGRGSQAAGSRQAKDLLRKRDETATNAARAEKIAWRSTNKRGLHAPFYRTLLYFSTASPAAAHWASCSPVAPEAPMAPTILPSMTIGKPPSSGTAPSSPSMRRPAPPPATASWNTLVGRLNRAAERALPIATATLPVWVASIFSR